MTELKNNNKKNCAFSRKPLRLLKYGPVLFCQWRSQQVTKFKILNSDGEIFTYSTGKKSYLKLNCFNFFYLQLTEDCHFSCTQILLYQFFFQKLPLFCIKLTYDDIRLCSHATSFSFTFDIALYVLRGCLFICFL